MRMDEIVDFDIADNQGNLFAFAASHGYDMGDFITNFMRSEVTALSLDAEYSYLQLQPPHILLDYLPDVAASKKIGECSDADQAWWIGYAYRFLCRKKSLRSKDVVKYLTPDIMAGVYPGYHTFTNEQYLLERLYSDYADNKSNTVAS